MIVSRKVSSATALSALAIIVVWALERYAGIVLTTEQAMAGMTALAAAAGYWTREDARVAGEFKLKGRHRQVSVGELVEQREQDRADGLYDTERALAALER